MGMGYRVFFVDQSDRPHRISQARFNALLDGEPGTTVPAPFIGEERVKYVLAVCETDQRWPSELLHIDCGILPLGTDGRLDTARREEVLRLVGLARSPFDSGRWVTRETGSVVDGTRIFAEKRLRHEWEWWPTAELQEEIRAAVLG